MKDGTMEAKIIALSNIETTIKDVVKNMMLDFFPVGTVISNITGTNPGDYIGGTWKEVGSGRVLQGADSSHSAGSTIAAGLPNITGYFSAFTYFKNNVTNSAGSFKNTTKVNISCANSSDNSTGTGFFNSTAIINASYSSSIYGASNTVQPPAYVVHFFQRMA